MFTLIQAITSYCHVCGKAVRVGLFALAGWQHVIGLCPSCLREKALEIEHATEGR